MPVLSIVSNILFLYLKVNNYTYHISFGISWNLKIFIRYLYIFSENNKIAEGENSVEFYFDTLITSPPAKLECKSDTANS